MAEYCLVTPHPLLVEVLRNVDGTFSTARSAMKADFCKALTEHFFAHPVIREVQEVLQEAEKANSLQRLP